MTDLARREQLSELTQGLRCRCPGFSEMVQVRCKGFGGVRYCFYVCRDAAGVETAFPVGEPGLCRCSLGTVKDTASERFFSNDEAVWGFARCVKPMGLQPPVKAPQQPSTMMWSLLPAGLALGMVVWFVKK